jgi:hypothetical protein
MFDRAAADILAGWGLTVDPVDFNIFKATVPCPPNTYGELPPTVTFSVRFEGHVVNNTPTPSLSFIVHPITHAATCLYLQKNIRSAADLPKKQ